MTSLHISDNPPQYYKRLSHFWTPSTWQLDIPASYRRYPSTLLDNLHITE